MVMLPQVRMQFLPPYLLKTAPKVHRSNKNL